jgi:tRNA-2-methylthio-N6-dimethylallyladenosine synthase
MLVLDTPSSKKLFIKTYGCQMNAYDSGKIADTLKPLGYQLTQKAADADMVLLNTCHIREKAAEKVYSELGRLRDARAKKGKDTLLAVAGCVAQAEGDEMLRRAPYIDVVVGPQAYHRLPELITRALQRKNKGKAGKILDIDFPAIPKFDTLTLPTEPQPASAFLSIQEGCDKFCSFCVVPYTRGAEYSRNAKDILAEARQLLDLGAVELTLLGQNVNAWHGEGVDGSTWNLGQLLFAVAKLDGLKRLRYTTSHPRDMHDELYAAHRDILILMPFLHLPVQSGSDAVLVRMNRKHTAKFYLDIVDKLKTARPDIAFSSDFIVGSAGETEAEFQQTLKLVETVGFVQAYSFMYSPRPGTPAAGEVDQVHEHIKKERLHELQDLLNKQQVSFNQSMAHKTIPILLEKPGKQAGQLVGKSPWLQSVIVEAPTHRVGQLCDAVIESGQQNCLIGHLLSSPESSGYAGETNEPRAVDTASMSMARDDAAHSQSFLGETIHAA